MKQSRLRVVDEGEQLPPPQQPQGEHEYQGPHEPGVRYKLDSLSDMAKALIAVCVCLASIAWQCYGLWLVLKWIFHGLFG